MVAFQKERISAAITRIYGPGGEQLYLVEGSRKAALIDSGCGVGELGAFVRSLTDLPVIVLITHGHVDHALGISQFDTVYMSHLDLPILEDAYENDMRKWYLSTRPNLCEVEETDYIPLRTIGGIRDIHSGDTYDLGGITIEAVACGGHSPGSVLFLICEEETLVTGDACCFFTMLHGDTCLGISAYQKNLEAANARLKGRFQKVLTSHTKLEASVEVLDEVMHLCEEIKAGTDEKIEVASLGINGRVAKAFGNNGVSAYARLDGKYGNIVYNPEKIWE